MSYVITKKLNKKRQRSRFIPDKPRIIILSREATNANRGAYCFEKLFEWNILQVITNVF